MKRNSAEDENWFVYDCGLKLWRVALLDYYTSYEYIVNKLNGKDTTYKPKISIPEEIDTMIKPIVIKTWGRANCYTELRKIVNVDKQHYLAKVLMSR